MSRLAILICVLGGAIVAGTGLVWGQHRTAVDWTRSRGLVLSSDDWGLCGLLPDTTAIADLDRDVLAPGNIPDVYWHTTLEDSAMVVALGEVLARHRGRDGLPAVLQANYVLAALAYDQDAPDSAAAWSLHELPSLPPGYARPGLWQAVGAVRAAGLWHPELHGRLHYDPAMRRERTAESPAVQRAAAKHILAFPGIDTAWELGPWRDGPTLDHELDRNLAVFEALFGGRPRSVIAPDYHWYDDHERRWVSRGLRVIQGQRQQQRVDWQGREGRLRKVAHRAWTRWWHADRTYIDRNCLFEPVQQSPTHATTERAYRDVLDAWRRGEAAVLQAHRVNFAHLDEPVRRHGLSEIDGLLSRLVRREPVFLVDGEVADLARRGTSWSVRGDRLVVRNHTRARRLVAIPAAVVAMARRDHEEASTVPPRGWTVSLGPGETLVIDAFRGPSGL